MITDGEVLASFQQQLDELRKDYNEISFENLKLRAAIKKLK